MEWPSSPCGKYKIECLTAATFPGALNVIREDFFRDEAVCISMGISKNPKAVEELLELCADAALDGVSLVAVTIDGGEVVGVIFNKLQVQTSASSEKSFFEIFVEERCTQAPSRSLLEFMTDVDGRCDFFNKFGVDCSFELMFAGISRAHRGKKLSRLLFNAAIDVAKKLRNGPVGQMTLKDLGPAYSSLSPRAPVSKIPRICQSILTAKAMQKVAKSAGFGVYLRIPFKECMYNGKSFADIAKVEGGCELVAKVLD